MHHGLSVTPYIFTDFVNVTKFIESMSKHDGNVTHSINVTALESCRNSHNIRCASVRIGW